jgi:hypothetical protein
MSEKMKAKPVATGPGLRLDQLGGLIDSNIRVPVSADPASGELRHYCRKCRSKLPAPADNPRHAFCCRGCFNGFYRSRCRVCERDLRKTGKRGDAARMYCRPPANCRREAERWPEKYGDGQFSVFPATKLRSADSTGLKSDVGGDRPTAYSLRGWRWGGESDHDLFLCDASGSTIAHVALGGDGRYRLRAPAVALSPGTPLRDTWRLDWPSLEGAKRGAESFALMVLPLAAPIASRVRRENELANPMGPPVGRPALASDTAPSDWRATGDGSDTPGLPSFLQRARGGRDG